MSESLQAWLAEAGFGSQAALTPLQRGLGANEIWKLDPGAGEPPLVVRLFGPGRHESAIREAAAMRTARAGDVPAPTIIRQGEWGDRPVLVTSFAPGQLLADTILGNPSSAATLGTAFGTTLGTLHRLLAPDLDRPPNAWLELGGDAIVPLRPILAAVPAQGRLLHLDYHPLNVFVENDRVSGVIDWENTHAGPPHADVARTLAILRAMHLMNLVPPEAAPIIDAFAASFVAAHDIIVGPSPAPAALTAWGLAMTVRDLGQHAGKPGNPITTEAFSRLTAERDSAITLALAESPTQG